MKGTNKERLDKLEVDLKEMREMMQQSTTEMGETRVQINCWVCCANLTRVCLHVGLCSSYKQYTYLIHTCAQRKIKYNEHRK